MPTPAEIDHQARLKRERAKAARAAHIRANRKEGPSSSAGNDEAETTSSTGGPDGAAAAEDSAAGPYSADMGVVRDGPGWRGYLAMIGFEGHIRTQIRAAIGSYFYENRSDADRRLLRNAIETAIKASPFLDCEEPWSRSRRDALDYLDAQGGLSNVDEMVRDIAAELERDLKLGLPLKAKARHVFVADDIAQLVVDWSIDGTGPDGKHVHVGGSAADILRRGADGLWRYIIDNNQGTAVREPA
jgi:ketosteroid isomerase-like protein